MLLAAAAFPVRAQTTTAPGVLVSKQSMDLDEGGSADTYTLKLATEPAGEVTVTLSAEPADVIDFYVLNAERSPDDPITATFDRNDWNEPKTVGVRAKDDGDSADESATISHAVQGYGDITSADSVFVTVTDDDPASDTVALSVSPIELAESAAATEITVTATLNGGTRSAATPVTVNVSSGTAISGTDFAISPESFTTLQITNSGVKFIPVTEFTIPIPAGAASNTGTFSLDPTEDAIDEPDETVAVDGSTSVDGLSVTGATVTITDDDATPTVTLALSRTSISEADDSSTTGVEENKTTVTASLDVASSAETKVTVSVAPNAPATGSDYMLSTNKVLTIAAGATSSTGEVTITANDNDVDAADKTVKVKGDAANTLGATGPANVTLTIEDDDATPTVTLALSRTSIAESDDSNTQNVAEHKTTVTASLDVASSAETKVTISVDPDAPATGSDYTLSTNKVLTIAEGATSSTGEVTIMATDNDVDAADKTVKVKGDAANKVGATDPADVTLTLADDDERGMVVSKRTLAIVEGGLLKEYTLKLATQPAGEVTVTLSAEPADVIDFKVLNAADPITATFDQNSWDEPKTVYVWAGHDDDHEDESATISHAVQGYGNVTSADSVSVAVTDEDKPAVLFDPISVTVTEGGTAAFTVKLATKPVGTVTVTPKSGDETVATVSGALSLDATNWNQGLSVTVTGVEDDDGVGDSTTVSHSVSGYGDVTSAGPVLVTVTDNDAALVLTSAFVAVYEGLYDQPVLDNQTYRVSLAAAPAGTVTVTPRSRDEARVAVSGPLTFNAANWSMDQDVVLRGVLDEDGYDHEVTIDHSVTGYDAPPATVRTSVKDYHGKTLIVQPRELNLFEGKTATYSVRLRTDPQATVIVTPAVGDDSVAAVTGAMTFDSGNWSVDQFATVTAKSDIEIGGGSTIVTHSVSGYEGYTETYPGQFFFLGNSAPVVSSVNINVAGGDPGLSISRTAVTVTEAAGAGRTTTYRVALGSRPTAAVTVALATGDPKVATVEPAELTFEPDDYVPGGALGFSGKTVTVTGVDDDLDNDPERTTTITHSASGGGYDGISETVKVTLTDDETPGVLVSKQTLAVIEGGLARDYTLKLATQPAGEVTVTLSAEPADVIDFSVSGAAEPITATFDQNSWDEPKTVSVWAGHDDDGENESATISHAVQGYGDVTSADSVSVVVADDDEKDVKDNIPVPTVTLALSRTSIAESDDSGTVGVEENKATVTASLDMVSGAETKVTISVEPDSPAISSDYSISSNKVLTIAAGETASTGTVTITANDNAIDAANKTVKVKGDAANSLGATDPTDVTLTLADDDTRGVTLSADSLSVNEGGSATYTVKLDTRPTASVTVTPDRSSGDSDVTVSGALTFTTANWSGAQTVTVRAAQDDDQDDDTAEIGHAVTGGDYASLSAGTVAVTVDDDETASDTVTLSVSPDTVAESASATEITVTATLNGGTRSAATPVKVSVGSGTAISDTDYAVSPVSSYTLQITNSRAKPVPVSEFDIKIPAGAASHTGTFSLDPTQDAIDEPDETVAVDGSTTVSGLSVTDTTVKITDDDATPSVTLALSRDTIRETDDGSTQNVEEHKTTVTASLDVASSAETKVTVSVAPDAPATGSDYMLSTNKVLTIAAGATSSTGTVTITAADNDIDAADKTVKVKGDAANTLGATGPADTTLTIADDDTAGVTVSEDTLSVQAGETAGYTVVLGSEPTANVTVTPASGDLTKATVSGALTFTPSNWDTSQPVTVTGVAAGMATVTHAASSTDGKYPSSLSVDSVSVTVNASTKTYAIASAVTAAEGANASLAVTLGEAAPTGGLALSVEYDYSDSAATSADTGATPQTVTVNEGETTATLTIPLAADDQVEGDETFTATISTSVAGWNAASAGADVATVTIADDDDDSARIAFGNDAARSAKYTASVAENVSGGALDVPVTVSHLPGASTTFAVEVLNTGTATEYVNEQNPGDFRIATKSVTFGPADTSKTKNLSVTITNDSILEPDETIELRIAGADDPVDDLGDRYARDENGSLATLTVVNDEAPPAPTALMVKEGDTKLDLTWTPPTLPSDVTLTGYDVHYTSAPKTGEGMVADDADVQTGQSPPAADGWVDAGHSGATASQAIADLDNGTVYRLRVRAKIAAGASGWLTGAGTPRAPPTTLTLTTSATNNTADEDAGTVTVTATLDHAAVSDVEVTLSAGSASTAAASDDYTLPPAFTIAEGEIAATADVTIVDDDIDEDNETLALDASAGSLTVTGVTLTIADDDTRGVTVSVDSLTVDEGGSDTYTVKLNSQPTGSVTVTPSHSSGDSDVTVSGPLTFTTSNWSGTQTVTVSAAQDDDAENDTAVIGHTVTGGDYASLSTDSVRVTVTDDETASDTVTLSVSPDTVAESAEATAITVTATLNGGTRSATTPVSVNVGSGTATSGADFGAVTAFTITIPENSLSHTGTFSLDPTQDSVDEPDETVAVNGSTTVSGLSVTNTTVKITDDDAAPTVTLSLSRTSISEADDSSTTTVEEHKTTVTASLNRASSEATTVTVSVDPDAPATSSDYTLSANKVLTIAAGATASTGTVTITAVNNDIDAADKTVNVKGSAANTLGATDPADVALTIADEDTRGVTVSAQSLSVNEGSNATYTVKLNSQPTGSVTVTPGRSSGDSDVTVSGALTFTTANWSGAQRVTVSAAQDDDAENDTAVIGHTVTGGDYASLSTDSVSVTVDDDDTASDTVTLSVSPDTVAESAEATAITVTATLNGGTRSATTPVTVNVGSGTAVSGTDFGAVTAFTITIPENSLSHTVTFSLDPTQDSMDEPDETVAVDGSTTVSGLSVTDTTVKITDDDATPTVTLALSRDTIRETDDSNTQNVAEHRTTVTASLDVASSAETKVTISVVPDAPATSSDYTLSSNKVLTIAAGATSSTGTVTITAENNAIDAADKTVKVKGSAANTLGATDPADATLTIADDDTRGVTVSTQSLAVNEGGNATYTVKLDSQPTASVTVTPSRASGDSDVTVSGALTFMASNWSGAQTVTVSAAQDDDAENDTAEIVHAVTGGDYAAVTSDDVSVTVTDDDTASSAVTLSVSPDTVAESAEATEITVTATLNGGTRSAATPVTVNVGSGTATSGTDFAAVTEFTITIPANSLSHTGTFNLDPTQDTIDEADETVAVDGSTTVSGLSVTDATVKITDDDATPAVTLSLSRTSISEADDSSTTTVEEHKTTVTASLNRASSETTTVTVSVDPDSPATSSDYTLSANKVLTIAAGQTASTGTVTITATDNDIDAADKTVEVKGSAANTLGATGPTDVTLTIEDDDARSVTVSAESLTVDEGGTNTYTVKLNSQPTGSVTVTPSRFSGDTDVTVSGPLTFTTSNWSGVQTVTVSAAQDGDAENDTAEIEHAVSGGDYVAVTANDVSVTVSDDDTASDTVTLTVSPDTVAESANATEITVTAALNGGTRSTATPVTVNVGSGTATSGKDFGAVTAFTITIPANSPSHTGTFSLNPTQDTIDEAVETVEVDGSTTVLGFSVTDTTVKITDDDAAPTVTLALSRDTIRETDDSNTQNVAEHRTTVTASLNRASSEATTVTVSVAPDAPATSLDYTLSANKTLTIAAGATSSTGTVTITAADNDIDAADKTVQVKGSAANTHGATDPTDVTLTIADDDARGVTVSVDSLTVDEGDTDTYTVKLNSQPTASVTVTPFRFSGDTDVSVSGALTFTTANWSGAQTVTVSAAQDTDPDDDTAVIGHTVTGGDYASLSTDSVSVTVDDDDTASDTVTLSVSPDTVAESAEATAITVTATLNGGTRSATTPVTVNVGSGTAVSGTDFGAVTAFTITIPENSLSHTVTFSLDPTQDSMDEPDETVAVDGSTTVSGLSVTDTTVKITDDDAAPSGAITLALSPISAGEAAAATTVTVTATLPGSTTRSADTAITVRIGDSGDTATEGADYAAVDDVTLTISAGSMTGTATFSIDPTQDAIDEGAGEAVSVTGATNTSGLTVTGATFTITDDDAPAATIKAGTSPVTEGTAAEFTVELSSAAPDGGLTIALTVADASGSDFVAAANEGAKTLAFSSGETSRTYTVATVADAVDEADGDVEVTVGSGAGYTVGTPASASVTVTDDDAPAATIKAGTSPVNEGTAAEFTVELSSAAPDGGLTIALTVADASGSDFVAAANEGAKTLAFTSGETSRTYTVATVADAVDEVNGDVEVTVGSGAGYTVGTPASASVTVNDDDAAPSGAITLALSPISAGGAAAATTVTVTATLPGSTTRSADTAITVRIGDSGDAATEGADYAAVDDVTLTISAGSMTGTATFSIDPTQDAIDEGAGEAVSVTGATNASGLTVTGATFTITDDDAAPTVTLALSRDTIRETDDSNTQNVAEHRTTVTASLDLALGVETKVTISVAPDAPATDADYTLSSNKVLTIAAGQTASTGTVTITAANNDIDAADKTVKVKGSAANTHGAADPTDVTLTIADDDTRGVTVSVESLSVNEGSSATYTVKLDTKPTASVTVTPSHSSGDSDVTVSGALTFTTSNWSGAQTVTVRAAQDDDAENDTAVIGHTVTGGDYASLSAGTVAVTVDDDETASDTVTLSVSPDTVAESAEATEITVTAALNGSTRSATTPVTVNVGSGTATSGADFAAVTAFTITIPENSLSHTGTFSLDPTQDAIDEPDETVAVDGSTTVSGLSVTDTTVKITEDDAAPTVTLALSRDTIRETDNSNTQNVAEHRTTVTASLDVASSVETKVTISVDPDAPATSSDYTLSTNRTLTIAAGATASTGTVTITANDNAIDAADKTVKVKGDAANTLGAIGPTDVTLIIADDDARGVTVSVESLTVNEGNTNTYTVKLDTQPTGSVTVTPSHSSGDSDVTVSGALTFTTSNWNGTQTVTVSAAQDDDAENDTAVIGHTVTGGDYASLSAGTVAVTVDDDETASSAVTLTVSPDSVAESAEATEITVTAALNGGTRSAATPVTVNVGSGTATSGTDFAAVTAFMITIPENSLSHTGTFSLDPTQDSVDEPDETVAVDGSTSVDGLSVTDTTVKITDDDATPTVTLALSRDTIRETDDSNTQNVAEHRTTVTASLDVASSAKTKVTISVDPDAPATGSDYTLSANKVLTIAAGATASTGTVTITAENNDIDAADKTVKVKGDAANTLGATDPADATLTIADDDTRGVTVSVESLTVDEGDTDTYTVKLDTQPTASVTVTPDRSSGDSDVTVSGALTFTTSNWNGTQTVTVSAAQDDDAENDTAVIGHTVTGGDYASLSAGTVAVTVDDDETVSDTVTLTVSPDAVAESAEATEITVTAALNGGTRSAATPVSVSVGSGTATSGTDFAAVTAFTITIPANAESHTGTFSLNPTQDTTDEADETVAVDGSTTVSGFSVTNTTVKIPDDDATPAVTLALSRTTIAETDDSATTTVEEHKTTVTASLNRASSETTTVTVSVDPDSPATGSDYNISSNKVLTIPAGATSSTGTVTITAVNNAIDAADKTVKVKGSAANTHGATGPADVTLTLADDDTRGVTVSVDSLAVDEGGSDTYTVKLDTQPTATVTVTPSRSSGDTDVTVSGALTFTTANWSGTQTVTVRAAQDDDAENDTAEIGHTVTGGDYASLSAGTVAVTVEDDETASDTVALSVSPDAVAESANATEITVTATLNGGARSATTPVTVNVGSGTATSGTDFGAVSAFTITILAGSVSQTGTFRLNPTQDAIDEPDETVAVDGSTSVDGLSVTDTMVKITDDDATPTVTLVLSRDTIRETDDSSTQNVAEHRTTVTASLDVASSEETQVTISVDPDAPATSSDYSISSNKVLTIAADATSSTGTVTITAVDNDIDAEDKTIKVKGDATNSLGATNPTDLTLTLTDEDTRGVTVSVDSLTVDEGDTDTYTVKLDTQPTATVTVTPSRSSGDTDVTVSGALTFTTANWSGAQTVTVSAAQDTDPDDDKAEIGHAVTGADYASLAAGSVSVTVDDDETASDTVTLTASPTEVAESATATEITVTATLNGGTRSVTTPVTVTVGSGTATSGTDFGAVTAFTITIPTDSASHTGTFSLNPTQDSVDEPDETVAVNGSTTVAGLSVTNTTVKIIDDDTAPRDDDDETASDTVALTVSPDSVDESANATDIVVTATLNGSARSAATPVAVNVGSGAAISGTDFAAVTAFTITIPADSLSHTGTFSLNPTQDAVDEPDETVAVNGSTTVSGLSVMGAAVKIVDDDAPTLPNAVRLSIQPSSVAESYGATTVTVTATLNGGTRTEATPVTVGVGSGTATSGVDYEAVPAFTITIPANAASHTGAFSLDPAQDAIVEGNETVAINGSTSVDGLPVTGTELTIIDDDPIELPNDPGSSDGAVTTAEDTVYVYASDDFGFSDADESSSAQSITIVSVPASGSLMINGAMAAPGDVVDRQSIDSGILSFQPEENEYGMSYTSFSFKITDANNRAGAADTMSVNVMPMNDPATGKPVISGTPEVGRTLFARTSAIEDIDGLTRVQFNYQWIRLESGQDVEVENANGSAYAPVEADAGRELKVEVSFTDDSGFAEKLVSDPVGVAELPVPATVPGAPRSLTAAAAQRRVALNWQAPVSDGGAAIRDYEYRFSEGARIAAGATWRSAGTDLSETVTGLEGGQLYSFEVRAVNSVGPGPAASGSAETPAKRKIDSLLIEGWLARFGRAASGDTAEAIRQRLEEGPQRTRLTVGGRDVLGLFAPREDIAGKPLALISLPETGETAMDRMRFANSAGPAAGHLPGGFGAGPQTTGGFGGGPGSAAGYDIGVEIGMENGRVVSAGIGNRRALPKLRDLLLGSSFHYEFAAEETSGEAETAGSRTIWGSTNSTRFDASEGSMRLDGDVMTGTLGFDFHSGRLLGGVAVSYSEGEGRFQAGQSGFGVIGSSLSGVYPYAHLQVDRRTSFWGTFGVGKGELRVEPDGTDVTTVSDLGNTMAAFGGRGVVSVFQGNGGRFELALRSDVLLTDTSAEDSALLKETQASTRRLRLMLEATGSIESEGIVFNPTFEAGLRHDAGDAEEGTGFEIGGGLAWSAGPLTLQLNGRGLLAHEDESYREWGYSVGMQYRPGADGRGLMLNLTSARGAIHGGAERLWSAPDASGLPRSQGFMPSQSVQLEIGYGLESAWRRALWYPYLGVETFSDNGQAFRLGLKIHAQRIDAGIEFGQSYSGFDVPRDAIQLRGTFRW